MRHAPGGSPRRPLRFVWILPVVAVVAIGAAVFLTRTPHREKEARRGGAAAAAGEAAAADLLAQLRTERDPMAFVQARAGKEDAATIAELIQAYAAWAPRAETLEARREIVKQLLGNSNIRVGVEALLKAVALDTTPRRADPLWKDLVAYVSGQWDRKTIAWGLDLVQTESNPRTKDLLLESLANVSADKISLEQKDLLVTDLIDLYPYAAADQKPALDKALAAAAGPDVVEILAHRGINEGSTPLASIQAINQEIEANRTKYRKVLQQIEDEDREAQQTNAREAAKSKP